MSERLNLGCGTDVREGWVNLDIAPLAGVEVVHDLGRLPLPFHDERFSEILAKDVLEHLDYVPLLRELHRILAPGGALHVVSPHFTSAAVWLDPTHRTAFSIDTLRFFAQEDRFGARSYYFDFAFSHVERAHIAFHRYRWQPWNYVVEPIVNARPNFQTYYEETAVSRLFPASNVEVTLCK